jgi:hypothetical protein
MAACRQDRCWAAGRTPKAAAEDAKSELHYKNKESDHVFAIQIQTQTGPVEQRQAGRTETAA